MKRSRLFLLILCLFLNYCFLSQATSISIPFVKNYPPSKYKAKNDNWAIIQDNRGIMYFGNMGGILEFDGIHWRNIAPNVSILSMTKDEKGTIYCAGINDVGYLGYSENGETIFLSIIDDQTRSDRFLGNFYDIIVKSDTVFFFSIRGYIVKYLNGKTSITQIPNRIINLIRIGTDILISTDVGLSKFSWDSIEGIPNGDYLKDHRLRLSFEMNDTLFAVTRTGGFFFLDNGKLNALQNPSNQFIIQNQVYTATTIRDSIIAFGTVSNGVLVTDIRGNPLQHINRMGGLQSNDHCAVFFDNRLNLWSGLEYGISCSFISSPFSQINEQWGLINATVYNLLICKGFLLVGTAQGVYYINLQENNNLDNQKFSLIKETQGRKVWVLNIFDDDLISTSSNVGTFHIKNFKGELISKQVARELVSPRKGFLLGSIEHGGLGVFEKKNGSWIYKKEFSQYPNLKSLTIDNEGNLWGNDNNERVICLSFDNNFNAVIQEHRFDSIPDLISFKNITTFKLFDQIMIGTSKGTYKYQDGVFVVNHDFNKATGENFHAQSVKTDSQGFPWLMGLSNGFEVIGRVIGNDKILERVELYDIPLRKLSDYNIFSFLPIDNSRIYFGSSEKVILFNPQQSNYCLDNFSVLIRSVEVTKPKDSLLFGGAFIESGKPVNRQTNANTPNIKFINNAIRIKYSGIFYEESEKTKYQIKLDGYEKEWSDWSTRTEKEYSYLKEGNYRFCVRASNIFGIISSEAYYSFTILPPWYRTTYAFFMYVILFGFLVFLAVKLSIRRIHAEKVWLEKVVAERTAKVIEQKEEILVQNESLNQQKEEILAQSEVLMEQNERILKQNQEITSSIQYASTIQMALLTSKETIDQLFPENLIVYKPLNIVSGDFYWLKKLNDVIVIAVADCTGHGVPGAFMSMLGIAFLNEIVRKREVCKASEVLNEMRREVKLSLGQTGNEGLSRDGMELGLAVIYENEGVLEYSGANIPLLLFRNENGQTKLEEFKPDSMPIGVYFKEKDSFTNHRIKLMPNDRIYMFSDGYADQIGEKDNKRFSKKRLVNFLFENQSLSMLEQKVKLEEMLENWAGNKTQIDDILIAGFNVGSRSTLKL